MRASRWVIAGLAAALAGGVVLQLAVGAAEAWRALTASVPAAQPDKAEPARSPRSTTTEVSPSARALGRPAGVTRLIPQVLVPGTVDAVVPMSSLVQRREEREHWREGLTPEERRARREEARARRNELSPEERELLRVRKEATRALLEGRPANLPHPDDEALSPDDGLFPLDDELGEDEDW